MYVLSPYDMVWNSDAYYVCGYSKSHGKVVTFRVDRFGEQVQTGRYDSSHFTARVQVSVSPTFYAWVFTYGGQIEILSLEPVRQEYAQRLQAALKQSK